jgi:glyoxylase-like metal-dependent hydrolase (beta-lactamase superfamily II)
MNRYLQLINAALLCTLSYTSLGDSLVDEVATNVGFSVIKTASTGLTPEAVLVEGGSWFKLRQLAQNAVLIRHPKGDVLIDTGLGKNIHEQFEENDFLDRQLFRFEALNPVHSQLQDASYNPNNISKIIPSHLHWDHASGIEDFPLAQVWVQKAELKQAQQGTAPAHLQSQLNVPSIQWHFFDLLNTPYKGFQRSLDLYQDGSIVLVDLSGHSAAQVGVFLTLTSGAQYFFIGDTTWTTKGIVDNAPRSELIKWLVHLNFDDEQNEGQIARLHQLFKTNKDLTLVPAHDELIMAQLPVYPEIKY